MSTRHRAGGSVEETGRLEHVLGVLGLVTCAGAGVLALLGAAGLTGPLVFAQSSLLKQMLLVAAPLGLVLLVRTRNRPLALGVLVVLVAPLSFGASIAGVALTPLTVALVPAVVLVRWSTATTGTPTRRTGLGRVALLACPALAVPLLLSERPSSYVLLLLSGAGTLYVVSTLARRAEHRQVLVQALVLSVLVQALLALLEFRGGYRLNPYTDEAATLYGGGDYFFSFGDVQRSAAALPDPIALGNVLALTTPFLLALTGLGKRPVPAVAAATGVLLLAGLGTTLSRLSWVAAVVGSLAAVALLQRGRRLRPALAMLAVLAVAVAASVALGGESVTERAASILDPTAESVATAEGDRARLQLQGAALDVAVEHPLTGVGLGGLPAELQRRVPDANAGSHAHSTYLQLAAETGAVGLLLLLALVLAVAADYRRARRVDPSLAAAAVGALVAVVLVWSTDYTIRSASVMALMCVPLGLLNGAARQALQAVEPHDDPAAPGQAYRTRREIPARCTIVGTPA